MRLQGTEVNAWSPGFRLQQAEDTMLGQETNICAVGYKGWINLDKSRRMQT